MVEILCVVSLLTALVGCAVDGVIPKPTVSEALIVEFLEIVNRGDFHGMAQAGKKAFERGLYIPNHDELFGQFPSTEPQPGRIRYVLYSFRGDESAGEIYLIVIRDTGEIVEFADIEATFLTVDSSQISVKTDRESYAIGNVITITVKNLLGEPIRFYEGCSLHLCQYAADDWICEMKECHDQLILLQSGHTRETRREAKDLAGTRLRFKLEFQIGSRDTLYTAYSNEFTINPPESTRPKWTGGRAKVVRPSAMDKVLPSPKVSLTE